jgi:hypothetical protein
MVLFFFLLRWKIENHSEKHSPFSLFSERRFAWTHESRIGTEQWTPNKLLKIYHGDVTEIIHVGRTQRHAGGYLWSIHAEITRDHWQHDRWTAYVSHVPFLRQFSCEKFENRENPRDALRDSLTVIWFSPCLVTAPLHWRKWQKGGVYSSWQGAVFVSATITSLLSATQLQRIKDRDPETAPKKRTRKRERWRHYRAYSANGNNYGIQWCDGLWIPPWMHVSLPKGHTNLVLNQRNYPVYCEIMAIGWRIQQDFRGNLSKRSRQSVHSSVTCLHRGKLCHLVIFNTRCLLFWEENKSKAFQEKLFRKLLSC